MAVAVVLAGPLAVTSTVGATPVAESQSVSVTENVDVWERSPLTLRTTSEGPTTIVAPQTFINVESAATGDLPLNKRTMTIHERNESINLSFESRIGAGTRALAGDEAQLLAVKVDEAPTTAGVNTSNISAASLDDVFANNSNITSSELLDDSEGVGAISAEGEVNASYTPESGGAYGFVLVTVDEGDEGLSVSDGNVSVNGNVTVVGVEQAVVQDNASNVERTQNPVNPGDNVTLNVDTEIEDENVTHAVLLVRQGELQRQSSTVTVSGELNESFSTDQITVENSFDGVSGVATVGDNTSIAGVNLSGNQSIPAIGLQGLFGTLISEAESDAEGDVIHASATLASGDSDTNVTVQTLDSWPNGAYQYVHVAVGTESGSINSDTGTVALSPGGGPDNGGGPSNGGGPPDNPAGPNDAGDDDEGEADN
ncbi:PGF-CTERM sorting domain-containing protein [Haloarcula sp. CBA1130]|uniref:PGF-CTERM sorting domain-containing protein n=1 Tax=unclassified Haloarcula TaxID=2624677 RepID=UPI001244A912|nr:MULTISPECIES: PGF-CTERM sorting domain-containing protein [unclassified Haloarcula]KAA9397850.1 PGF-CTERM sorting domain-containing protein [Haloarcula sp. CBA1129]KAA9404039.1 PGF-CTERM sorting domain-containing protein [Haloarcula sp. CBA1130]